MKIASHRLFAIARSYTENEVDAVLNALAGDPPINAGELGSYLTYTYNLSSGDNATVRLRAGINAYLGRAWDHFVKPLPEVYRSIPHEISLGDGRQDYYLPFSTTQGASLAKFLDNLSLDSWGRWFFQSWMCVGERCCVCQGYAVRLRVTSLLNRPTVRETPGGETYFRPDSPDILRFVHSNCWESKRCRRCSSLPALVDIESVACKQCGRIPLGYLRAPAASGATLRRLARTRIGE